MTAQEMKNEFRTGFDEAMSFSAPAMDDYDVSVFLTRAQENLLKRHYRAVGNRYAEAFDASEKRKRDFDELLRSSSTNLQSTVQTGAVPNGRFFDLPADHMLTVMERADIRLTVADPCYPTGIIQNVGIKPIGWDQYLSNKDNPFKKPHKGLMWRLVHSRGSTASTLSQSNRKRVQLVSDGTYQVNMYYVTYLARPRPIVTATLTGGLSIDGVTAATDSELDPVLHREIVSEAVRLASASLRDSGYQADGMESGLSE